MAKYRKIDGTDNNQTDYYLGSTGIDFFRYGDSYYGDGISTMGGTDRPEARVISNAVFAQDHEITSSFGYSNILWLWGQFVDHDFDLTMDPIIPELAPVLVPIGDPFFDPFGTGTQILPFKRSGFNLETGVDVPREQVNTLTAYMDASQIYGSDQARAEWLRADDGKLKVSEGDLMPYNDGTQANAMGPSPLFFVAGDVRANENTALTVIHTIFVREHNRLVDELSALHPEYDSDTLYNEAKMIVEAR